MKGRCFRMSYTLLVNKSHPLTSSYVPPCLAEAHIPFDTSAHDEKTLMEKTAAKAEEKAEKKATKKSSKKEEAPMIQNQAASTTLGDIDALAALKEQLEGKK